MTLLRNAKCFYVNYTLKKLNSCRDAATLPSFPAGGEETFVLVCAYSGYLDVLWTDAALNQKNPVLFYELDMMPGLYVPVLLRTSP